VTVPFAVKVVMLAQQVVRAQNPKLAPASRLAFRSRPRLKIASPPRAIDWTDSDTWVGLAGAVLGLGLGIGAPMFYTSRIDEDEKALEELRKINRKTFKETGQYLTEVRRQQ
jgi:hypothetical protein